RSHPPPLKCPTVSRGIYTNPEDANRNASDTARVILERLADVGRGSRVLNRGFRSVPSPWFAAAINVGGAPSAMRSITPEPMPLDY
ncbi:MAG: hypothetical protein ABI672_15520, partial [Vicinamibacteria bacterium]